MGEARRRGTREERIQQSIERGGFALAPRLHRAVEDVAVQSTLSLIRRYARTVVNTPEAVQCKRELKRRQATGDEFAGLFLRVAPGLRRRTVAEVHGALEGWLATVPADVLAKAASARVSFTKVQDPTSWGV